MGFLFKSTKNRYKFQKIPKEGIKFQPEINYLYLSGVFLSVFIRLNFI